MNSPARPGRTVEVVLPVLHPGQVAAYQVIRSNRFVAVRCGRRFGKTDLGKVILGDDAIKGYPVGWFAPDYKRLAEAYGEIASMLDPVRASSSKVEGVFRTITGGRIDFWTLEDEGAGRSRKYKRVFVDEGAFTKNGSAESKTGMIGTWEKAIKPTLLDMSGSAVVASNTNGIDPENFFYQICPRDGEVKSKYGFAEYHATSMDNPHVPQRLAEESDTDYALRRAEGFAALIRDNHPLVYRQEYLAEFVDWSGVAFFSLDAMLVGGAPIELPTHCDGVYAVIDSATKTGRENDGTGVTYFALTRVGAGVVAHPLVILDYDLAQIEGAMLETWLPSVYTRLEDFAKSCRARHGSMGVWIEDKASGMILLQQAQRRGWMAHAIDSKLTAVGKTERAISVSGYVYRKLVKMARPAFDRVITYKGTTRNHLIGQVVGFRVGSKDQVDDDLLDTFTYGVAIGLGNAEGF